MGNRHRKLHQQKLESNKPSSKEQLKKSEGSTDHFSPHFSFDHCDKKKFTFEEMKQEDKVNYLNLLHLMSLCTWKSIFASKGFDAKNRKQNTINKKFKLPKSVPKDVPIIRIRVDQERRIWGYRDKRTYHIIWFDKNHEVDKM